MNHLLLLFIALFTCFDLQANQVSRPEQSEFVRLSNQELLTMKPREIVEKTGTKLNFFERLLIRKIQKKAKKEKKSANAGFGTVSLLLGIVSLASVLLFVASPWFLLIGLFAGLFGLIFGGVGMDRLEGNALKRAKAGFWLSLVGISFMLIGFLTVAVSFVA